MRPFDSVTLRFPAFVAASPGIAKHWGRPWRHNAGRAFSEFADIQWFNFRSLGLRLRRHGVCLASLRDERQGTRLDIGGELIRKAQAVFKDLDVAEGHVAVFNWRGGPFPTFREGLTSFYVVRSADDGTWIVDGPPGPVRYGFVPDAPYPTAIDLKDHRPERSIAAELGIPLGHVEDALAAFAPEWHVLVDAGIRVVTRRSFRTRLMRRT